MTSRTYRAVGRVAVVSLVLVALFIAGLAPSGVARATPVETSAAVATATADSNSSASFAYRAGYDAARLAWVPGATPSTGSREVVVTFAPRDPAVFYAPVPGQRPMSVATIADRFGLTPTEYAAAESYFVGEGLTVLHTWPDRLALSLQGPVGAIDRAFSTSIVEGSYQGRSVSFPASAPGLPGPFEGEVEGVLGLSSGFDSFRLAPLGLSDRPGPSTTPGQSNPNLITPAIARQIYGLSDLYNRTPGAAQYSTSQSIAVLLWGPGYVPSDLTTFYQQYYPSSFPKPTITPEPLDGAPAPSSSAANDRCNASVELTLDLEWSGSMAPGATLYPVYVPEGTSSCSPSSTDMSDALRTAIGLPVDAISMSFGTPESQDGALSATWETLLAEAVQRGITPLAATGDFGGDLGTGCSGGPSLQYPSSSSYVLAVGGSQVALSRNVFGQITGFNETAWSGSGGGFSTQFPAPSWQHLGSKARGEPDVSATAAGNFLYFSGQQQVGDGTSFATPLWAGLVTQMTAEYGRSMAPLAPRLYEIGAAEPAGQILNGLSDIRSGSTCIGAAGPGWDEETGWGSPQSLALYEDLTATIVALSLSFDPASVGPGGSVTITARLSNESTGAPIGGVPIEITLASSSDLGPCTGTFGGATPVSDNATGETSATFTVPSCFLGSSAVASALVESGTYYGSTSASVPVNLLAYVPFLGGLTTFPDNVAGFGVIFAAATVIGYFLGRPRRRRPAGPVGTPPPLAGTGHGSTPSPAAERETPHAAPDPSTVSTAGPPSTEGPAIAAAGEPPRPSTETSPTVGDAPKTP